MHIFRKKSICILFENLFLQLFFDKVELTPELLQGWLTRVEG